MQRTIVKSAPVITFLSPSIEATYCIIESIQQWRRSSNNDDTKQSSAVLSSTTTTSSTISTKLRDDELSFDALDIKLGTPLNQYKWGMLGGGGGMNNTAPTKWESIVLQTSRNGPIIHWLSPSSLSGTTTTNVDDSSLSTRTSTPTIATMSLVAIHGEYQTIAKLRDRIALQIPKPIRVSFGSLVQYKIKELLSSTRSQTPVTYTTQQLFNTDIPFIDFSSSVNDEDGEKSKITKTPTTTTWEYGDVKEIVIPTNMEDTDEVNNLLDRLYEESTSLLSSNRLLQRAVPGLYQTTDGSGLCIRPVPSAGTDHHLSPPTLIFHTDNVDTFYHTNVSNNTSTNNLLPSTFGKIGYKGGNNNSITTSSSSSTIMPKSAPPIVQGQIVIRTEPYFGFDIRFCSNTTVTSMFNEAQESLLAGSLPELQSDSVTASGNSSKTTGATISTTIDDTSTATAVSTGGGGSITVTKTTTAKNIHTTPISSSSSSSTVVEGDCWSEFRASVKNPSGYIKVIKSSFQEKTTKRTAIAPDLPYE